MAHDGEEGGLGLRGGLSLGQRKVELAVFLLNLLRVGVNFGLRPFPFNELTDLAADVTNTCSRSSSGERIS